MRFGVVRFPGTCDDVDALEACAKVGDAEILWHGDRDLKGVDAIVVPGGFSYGDYLRVGAIARFSPVMESVAGVRPRGRAGARASATASRCCARRACCPARCCRTSGCGSSAGRSASSWSATDTAFTSACEPGQILSIPVKHTTGRYFAPDPAALEAAGQVVLRYAHDGNPNGSSNDIAGVCNEGRNVVGLMPHPEHAVDELLGSADGLRLFESAARVGVPA